MMWVGLGDVGRGAGVMVFDVHSRTIPPRGIKINADRQRFAQRAMRPVVAAR
jgi:hypothetical protein